MKSGETRLLRSSIDFTGNLVQGCSYARPLRILYFSLADALSLAEYILTFADERNGKEYVVFH